MIKVVEIVREIVQQASDMYVETYPNAKPVHFFADNFLAIGNELSIRGQSTKGAKAKYPAILLFCDDLKERHENMKQWEVEATLHILIVADATEGSGDVHRDKVFYPVLYPIFKCFFDVIYASPRVFTMGDALTFDKSDKILINAVIGKNRLFADKLDGIDIRNLRLKLVEEDCFFNT